MLQMYPGFGCTILITIISITVKIYNWCCRDSVGLFLAQNGPLRSLCITVNMICLRTVRAEPRRLGEKFIMKKVIQQLFNKLLTNTFGEDLNLYIYSQLTYIISALMIFIEGVSKTPLLGAKVSLWKKNPDRCRTEFSWIWWLGLYLKIFQEANFLQAYTIKFEAELTCYKTS